METKENFSENKQNFGSATDPEFHDIKCATFTQAENVYRIAIDAFRAVIKGEPAEAFIQRLGDVVRVPAWFRIQLH